MPDSMPTLPKSKRPPWMPEPKKSNWSKSPNADKYKLAAWRNLAAAHKRQNPLCVMCLAKGIRMPVEVTDHIKAIRDGGELLDWYNLQSLCKPCHMIKTDEETKARRRAGAPAHPGV